MYHKRLTHIKRDLRLSKETYVCMKRDLNMYQKRLTNIERNLYLSNWTHVCMKKDLHTYHKRLTHIKRNLHLSKKTYVCMKRDLLMYEKRLHVFHVHMCVCGRECEDDIVNHVAVCDVVEELGETTCYICVCVCVSRETTCLSKYLCTHTGHHRAGH